MIREDQYAGLLMTVKSLQARAEEAEAGNAALRARLDTLLTAAEDMLSTYRHDDKSVLVTAERQEAWVNALKGARHE